MVAAGEGWSIVPALAVPDPDPLTGLVAHTPFDCPEISRRIALAWRTTTPRASDLTALADFLAGIAPFPGGPGSGDIEA
jgi:LysR family hydrogen peroxide-inducible transcriptional activator